MKAEAAEELKKRTRDDDSFIFIYYLVFVLAKIR